MTEQDHQEPLPAQPCEARSHNMHIERKLLLVAIDGDHLRI